MSLRSRIVMVLVPVVAGYALVDHVLQRSIIRPSFDALEREFAVRDIERTEAAIEAEVEHVAERAARWAEMDGLREFVENPEPGFPALNLEPVAFKNGSLHLVYVIDRQGKVLWGDARRERAGPSLDLRDFPRERFADTHRLVAHERPHEVLQGLWDTEEGPLLVASHPILAPGMDERVDGRLILGRFLSGRAMERVAQRTRVPFAFWSLESGNLPDEVAELLDEVTAAAIPTLRTVSDREAHVYTTLLDVRKQPILLLRATIDRSISREGATSIDYALLSTLAAGLILVFTLLRLLQRVVVDPLARLTEHAVSIGKSDDGSLRLGMVRNDEIGTLAGEFDAMLAKLEASRAAVVTAARAAGMSEIATGVLHNVGNVLNSVVVSSGVMEDKLRSSRVAHLEKLAALLESHRDDLPVFVAEDPKGKQVVSFLTALTRQLSDERGALQAELGQLNDALEHIRQLIASQQAYAGRSTLLEPADVSEQVEMALRLADKASGTQVELRVERDLAPLPRMPLDKHKLVEILVNLVQNARQSIAEARPDDPCIHVESRHEDGVLRVRVRDNGVGIPAENLTRIFNHGFTTKRDGHGFGLHASANAAVEMGGRLMAHSDGPGRGAAFTLEIPVTGAITAKAS